VVKGVTRELIRDRAGRVYCHRHGDSYWLPGGASNTGGEYLARTFQRDNLRALDNAAMEIAPSGRIAYPLMGKGERFPFVNPDAEGFFPAGYLDNALRYTACLEGVGYLERLCYDVLAGLGAEIGPELFMAGGAAQSVPWLQIRADILGKTLLVPESGGGAKGAAIIAAGATVFGELAPAAAAMVRIVRRVQPRPQNRMAYSEGYRRFLEALRQRRYIP
jgi:sugar (pentulose or hexulose) kinase